MKKEIKIRRSWGIINPMTKIIQSKKRYNRKKLKKATEED